MSALILTYHAVEPGPAPLCLEPELFRRHVDVLDECGARTLTVAQLAAALRGGTLPDRAVALTFDDAFASAVRVAPTLREKGFTATYFAVAGFLGGVNDWPSQIATAPRLQLAGAEDLHELAAAGFEIGSHGWAHEPLDALASAVLEQELGQAQSTLAALSRSEVRSYALPYGAEPAGPAQEALAATYSAVCTSRFGQVQLDSDPLALPRIDSHYLRRPELLRRAIEGKAGGYLTARRFGARARRVLRKDHAARTVATTGRIG